MDPGISGRVALVSGGGSGSGLEIAQRLAALVSFLCGEEAGYVNGEVIGVDGGQTRSLF